jgi:hypothetical protein
MLVVVGCLATTGWAQGGPGGGRARFEPSRPTISPYLNLLRRDVGPLPNYYSLVRPQLQQNDFNQRQIAINREQRTAIRANAQQIQEVQSGAASTGTASVYRNYGHYYPSMSASGPPARAR